jgi:hypothetical protein
MAGGRTFENVICLPVANRSWQLSQTPHFYLCRAQKSRAPHLFAALARSTVVTSTRTFLASRRTDNLPGWATPKIKKPDSSFLEPGAQYKKGSPRGEPLRLLRKPGFRPAYRSGRV